jgi:hypothetical protein
MQKGIKGARIERLFRFFQDRLIKKMRLKRIKDYETANRLLKEEFLSTDSKYRDLPEDIDLEQVFSIKHRRKVNRELKCHERGGDTEKKGICTFGQTKEKDQSG